VQSVKAAFLADGPQHGSDHNGVCLLALWWRGGGGEVEEAGHGHGNVGAGGKFGAGRATPAR